MFAKRFFYVSAGFLCLALAYHLGASSATAQATKSQMVAAFWSDYLRVPGVGDYSGNVVVAANGDVYLSSSNYLSGAWVRVGNAITP